MNRIKYPRTPHLPWSNASSDDKKWDEVLFKPDDLIVVTEKMDGECTSIYSGGSCHARSMDSKDHPSRHWVKGMAPWYSQQLEKDEAFVGENCFARHSIAYDNLPSYFLAFGLRNSTHFLSWSELCLRAYIIKMSVVPMLYSGPFHLWRHARFQEYVDSLDRESEGYVVRTLGSFPVDEFHLNVAKYVRPNHVQTDEHWMNQPMVVNGLRKDNV